MNHRPTLIELTINIVVIGILVAVAIPRNEDITEAKRKSEYWSAQRALRSGITLYYANMAVETGTATWPTAEQLLTPGVVLNTIPSNPYQHPDNAPDSVVLGVNKGEQVGSRGGWVYNPKTGEIWPNTNVAGECAW